MGNVKVVYLFIYNICMYCIVICMLGRVYVDLEE